MIWLIIFFIILTISWLTKKSGHCDICNRRLIILSALFAKTKIIDNKVFCESCSKKNRLVNFPIPKKPIIIDHPEEYGFSVINIDFYEACKKNKYKRFLIKYKDFNNIYTERKVDIYFFDLEYCYCWCHLRNEPRTFKLSHIDKWEILNETFKWDNNIAICLQIKRKEI
ncbi:MAG: WYL domain-containing protein [Actinomycetota bacterium]